MLGEVNVQYWIYAIEIEYQQDYLLYSIEHSIDLKVNKRKMYKKKRLKNKPKNVFTIDYIANMICDLFDFCK